MAHRSFVDEDGEEWNVWDVQASTLETDRARLPNVATHLRHGWLAFETNREKRRLAPIPTEWESATESMLRRWCHEAETVAVR
jgi:hypothetical protein